MRKHTGAYEGYKNGTKSTSHNCILTSVQLKNSTSIRYGITVFGNNLPWIIVE